MFVFVEEKAPFWWDVEVPVISGNGVARNHKLKMKFRRMDREQLIELSERAQQRDGDPIENDVEYVLDVAEDWQVKTEKGEPLAFTRDNIRMFIKGVPTFMLALYKTWNQINILGGVKEKNL